MKLKSTVRTMEKPKGIVRGHLSDEDRQAIFMGMTIGERLSMAFGATHFVLSVKNGVKKNESKIRINR